MIRMVYLFLTDIIFTSVESQCTLYLIRISAVCDIGPKIQSLHQEEYRDYNVQTDIPFEI